MANSIIDDFTVLSPSQKRELERKRKEKEEREAAEAARKADEAEAKAARKAAEAEAAKREEERIAAIRAQKEACEAEKESKKNILRFWITVLCVILIIAVWIWIHYFIILGSNEVESMSPEKRESDAIPTWILIGFMYFLFTSIIAIPILAGIGCGIVNLRDKIKEMK